MKKNLSWAVGTVAVLVLSGCGETIDPAAEGLKVDAVLDEKTGAVILPYEQFTLDPVEESLLTTARSVAATVCAREKGVAFVAPTYVEQPIYLAETFFGPWTLWEAEKYGFVTPLPDADLRANGLVPEGYGEPSKLNAAQQAGNAELSEADFRVMDECSRSEQAQKFSPSTSGPWVDDIDSVQMSILEDEEIGAVLEELATCYRRSGMGAHDEVPGWPAGADAGVIDEQQITLAVKTVQCKNELGSTQKLADAWAEEQAPILRRYASELVAQRAAIDSAVAEATTYLAEHPEVFEPPA